MPRFPCRTLRDRALGENSGWMTGSTDSRSCAHIQPGPVLLKHPGGCNQSVGRGGAKPCEGSGRLCPLPPRDGKARACHSPVAAVGSESRGQPSTLPGQQPIPGAPARRLPWGPASRPGVCPRGSASVPINKSARSPFPPGNRSLAPGQGWVREARRDSRPRGGRLPGPAHRSSSHRSRRCSPSPRHTRGCSCSRRARCGSGRCAWCR